MNLTVDGDRVRLYRLLKGMTQEQLADIIGVNSATIGNTERQKSKPGPNTLRNLAEALDVSISDLVIDDTARNLWTS